ncbi:MAG: hypothetical protein ACI8WT_004923 [Clostridium sp.]|jgi:hypothetical protein
MKSISLKTKIITGLITGGMLVSSVSLAFATTTKSLKTDGKESLRSEFKQPKGHLEETLKLGVSSNIITQDESDKILAYKSSEIQIKEKKEKHIEKSDLFKELVDNNILTQVKADALKASEQIQMAAKRQEDLATNLAKLVTDKTITQVQADKIKVAIIAEESANKIERAKTESMTEAERKTYMDNNKANHISPLKALVDNRTITQAQADKVGFCEPYEKGKRDGKNSFKNDFKQPKAELEATLKVAVSSSIITQTESDKILEYENSKIKIRDKKEKNTIEKPDLFKELVSNKILTQAKADALKVSEQTQMLAKRQQAMETNLAKLVADKTITQAQADKIKAAMITEEAARKVERAKTESMTVAERKIYMDNNKANHISPLKALIDNGTITQAQADKVGPGNGNHMPGLKVK